jgi:hypothetical protein
MGIRENKTAGCQCAETTYVVQLLNMLHYDDPMLACFTVLVLSVVQ